MSATNPILRLDGIGKEYPVAVTNRGRLANLWMLLRHGRAATSFRALQEIGFDVMPGQSLGLIGENGAGKSTLLKIIANVVRPSQGRISRSGRFGALLELGAGFHPEYTGRDNIILAAALMGMNRAEATARIDDILSFADIGEHIDQPIKHYSSGMVVRLGFAVATVMQPDILITDEVLAVGDESFQKKCIAWMENYLANGGTLLLCSHNMFHIRKLCQKAVWIHHGRMKAFGDSNDVVRDYLAYHEEKNPSAAGPRPDTPPSSGDYYLIDLAVNGANCEGEALSLPMGSDLWISGRIHSPDGRTPNVAIGLVRADGTGVYGVVSDMDGFQPALAPDGSFRFALRYPDLPLLPGRYKVRGHAMDPEGLRMFDHVDRTIEVTGNTRELGLCRLNHHWHVEYPGQGND